MKVLVVPDIHGSWEQALKFIKENKDKVDKVVTLGDYVDDWDDAINGEPMHKGFLELVTMARAEPDKFRICLGNHDHSYISDQNCSGHHYEYEEMYAQMFLDNLDIIHPAVLIDGVLFSHAGVSQHWYNRAVSWYNERHKYDKVPLKLLKEREKWEYNNRHINEVYFDGRVFPLVNMKTEQEIADEKEYRKIQEDISDHIKDVYNRMQKYVGRGMSYTFSVENLRKIFIDDFNSLCHCGYSSSGDSPGESCIWIRPSSLMKDNWPGHLKCQVVGHTELGLRKYKWNKHKLIVCDSHEHDCGFILDTENIGDDFEQVRYEKNPMYNMRSNEALLRMLLGGAF